MPLQMTQLRGPASVTRNKELSDHGFQKSFLTSQKSPRIRMERPQWWSPSWGSSRDIWARLAPARRDVNLRAREPGADRFRTTQHTERMDEGKELGHAPRTPSSRVQTTANPAGLNQQYIKKYATVSKRNQTGEPKTPRHLNLPLQNTHINLMLL